ncbi:MAG: hypothetical protein IT370_17070 [Deltaproteobacteria bacterium]|nr:hypothetical protein [Deltaproteobacteria bacterium]
MRGCSGWALVMGVAGTLALAGAGCGGRARPGGAGGAGATTAARPGSSPSPAPSPASSPGPVVAPVALPEPPDVVALAAGASHTCALLASGRVSCWGASGRLGDVSALRGRVSDRVRWSVPALVSGVTDAVAIDAEAGRTCVVTRTGAARCWSAPEHQRWGHDLGTVAGVSDAVEVALGEHHTCARLRSGAVSCWSDGGGAPARVARLPAVVELTAGPQHSCARDAGGQIYCWGDGSGGQLGGAASSTAALKLPVTDAVRVAAGGLLTCAARQSGKVTCWGERWIGDPHLSRPTRPEAPGEQYGVDGISALAVGGAIGCGHGASGALECWSWGGDGDHTRAFQPDFEPLLVRTVAIGAAHICAVRADDGHVVCWGDDSLGQSGDGGNHDGTRARLVPGLGDARAISAGRRSSCVVHADGGVSCWGWNTGGQLGAGSEPERAEPRRVPGVTGVRVLAAGAAATCAVLASGAARCWGDNQLGTLGDASEQQHTDVVAVSGVSDAVAIDVTLGHLGVAQNSGAVVAWGRHGDQRATGGELVRVAAPVQRLAVNSWGYGCALHGGRVSCWGTAVADHAAQRVWTVSDLGLDAVDLALWEAVACAVTRAGGVACWSDGNDSWAKVTPAPTPRADISGATAIAVGGAHACALRRGGTVTCWGDNTRGQLGSGSYDATSLSVPVLGVKDAIAIDAGEDHTCALLRAGTVMCWGNNTHAQLGDPRLGGPPPWSFRAPTVVVGLAGLR